MKIKNKIQWNENKHQAEQRELGKIDRLMISSLSIQMSDYICYYYLIKLSIFFLLPYRKLGNQVLGLLTMWSKKS